MELIKNIKTIFKIVVKSSYLIIITALALSSCKKFVQIEPPTNKLVTTSVFDKNSTATAALLSIYAQMQSVPQTLELQTGLSSDEFKNYTSNLTADKLS